MLSIQTLIVALLVVGSAAFAAWSLMPTAARRFIARAALRWPLPETLASRARRVAAAPGGCGCDGCDRAGGPKPADAARGKAAAASNIAAPSVQPIRFHPRGRP